MRLKPLGANKTEVEIGDYVILFSYRTPVAYHKMGVGFYVTDRKYSPTTSRHINQWVGDAGVTVVPQDEIDSVVD